ncbi:hypothetical protein [Piscinibacter sp.]|uniref:hypothetical protein n=1 Tax=Piscinibacter sp. TaxID=1903157 RepID=UPI002C329E2C|nr:hypothetical protein [Albitalea sp.]HUG24152.1 hypothetical protein [Albitalea sp.]
MGVCFVGPPEAPAAAWFFRSYPELPELLLHPRAYAGQLIFQTLDLLLDRSNVDLGIGLEGVDLARDVEVAAVTLDLVEVGAVRVARDHAGLAGSQKRPGATVAVTSSVSRS